MKKLLLLFAVCAATAGVFATTVSASASSSTDSESFPFDVTVFVPCANGGAGEFVELTGSIHELLHLTLDDAGGAHMKSQSNLQGVSGTGMTTGDKYQATGVSGGEFTAKVGFESTTIENFNIVGQGKGNNFVLHENAHFTVNANGTVTAQHDNFGVDCK